MKTSCCGVLFSLVLSVHCTAVVAGEPPKIDRLQPPGMQRRTTSEINLVGKAGDGLLKVWSQKPGIEFEIADDQSKLTATCGQDVLPGIHWLRFYNEFGATDLIPFIVGLIPEVTEQEPNNDVNTAQTVESHSVTVNGVLDKNGEVDVFAVTLTAGKTFVASMQANRDLGSPMDSVLQLLDSRGIVIAHNDDDHGFDSQIVFDVLEDGDYFVRTFAFPATPNSSIRLAGSKDYVYRLTLTSEAFIDHVEPAIVYSESEQSVEVIGWNLSEDLKYQKLQASTDGFTTILGHSNFVEVERVAIETFAEEQLVVKTLSIPFSVTGSIESDGERDSYQVKAKKGQKLTVRVAARSLDSLLDPVLEITDSKGKVIKDADDKSREDLDIETSVTCEEGIHSITIGDRFDSSGSRFFYVLTVEETIPEFSASVKSNSFLIPTDESTLEIPVTIDRKNGFAENVTVSLEGPPPGIECKPVVSEKEGETAKSVTLKLVKTAEASGFSGPIKIRSVSQTGPGKFATAPIKNSDVETESLWLTIPTTRSGDSE